MSDIEANDVYVELAQRVAELERQLEALTRRVEPAIDDYEYRHTLNIERNF